MAEKKLSTATRDADITIEKLQRKLDDSHREYRRKEKEYIETIDQYQSDIESLASEKRELVEKNKAMNKKTLYDALTKRDTSLTGGVSPSSPTAPSSMSSSLGGNGGVVVKDSPMLLSQIADLRTALHHANALQYDAVAERMRRQLAQLKPLKVQSNTSNYTTKINDLTRELNGVRKELNELMVNVEVVDLTKRRSGTPDAPSHHLLNHNAKILALKAKVHTLQVLISF